MNSNKSVVLLNAVVSTRRVCFYSKSKERNVWGFTRNCHPEFISGSTPLVIIQNKEEMLKQVQHDNRRGFTLIELLVVVLIIGILAAVAVPQYQKAVWKSEFQRLVPILHGIYKGEQLYFVENGRYTPDWRELSISLPQGTKVTSNASYYKYTLSNGMKFDASVSDSTPRAFFKDTILDLELSSGKLWCHHRTDKLKLKICRAIGCPEDGINACSFKLF